MNHCSGFKFCDYCNFSINILRLLIILYLTWMYPNNGDALIATENSNFQLTPDLWWSQIGDAQISFSLGSYNGVDVPSWVTIDSSSGVLNIKAPEVTSNTNYYFYVNSLVSGSSNPIKKLIKLTVEKWVVKNWYKCSNQSGTIWAICASGYSLREGSWVSNLLIQTEDGAILKTILQAIIIGGAIVSVLSNLLNNTSLLSMWLIFEQVQLFLLLILTRAFIPEDVKEWITGISFVFNPFKFFSFLNMSTVNPIANNFNFKLTDSLYNSLNMDSDSTLYNIYMFIWLMMIVLLNHIIIYIVNKYTSGCRDDWKCGKLVRAIKKLQIKTIQILTFGYYIRSVLEYNQYLLVTSIYEISLWNTSETLRIVSLSIAIIVWASILFLIIIIGYLSLSIYKVVENSYNKIGEVFNEIKEGKKFKFYITMLLIRRFLFVSVLITLASANSRLITGILSFLQLMFATYVFILRPFISFKTNAINIINEIFFFVLLSLLIFWNVEGDWTSTKITIYIWILASNNILTFWITLSKFWITMYSLCSEESNQQLNQKLMK